MEIKIDNLSKSIDKVKVLKDISIRIRSGEAHALVGSNGAGKTTLINCILGLYSQYSGKIEIDGLDIRSKMFKQSRKNIAFVLDTTGLFVSLNAWDNIEFYDRLCNSNSTVAERKERVSKIFEIISLENRKYDSITKFSKGMKQRLALGRTMVCNPQAIILDEPFQGLDVEGKILLSSYLNGLKQKGCTILLSSHDLSEIEKICDVVSFVKCGEIVLTKNINRSENSVKYVHFKCVNQDVIIEKLRETGFVKNIDLNNDEVIVAVNSISELSQWLLQHNVEIKELYSASKSLEEIYQNVIM